MAPQNHIFSRSSRIVSGMLFLAVLLGILMILNVCFGSVAVSLPELFGLLLKGPTEDTASRILWDIRLPRLFAAVILGGALSVSGSSGARLVVAFVMIALLNQGRTAGSVTLILAAFFGSLISMGFVILVSGRVRNMSMLVVCGMMVSYICSAITDLAVTFADDANIVNLHNWSLGSFSGITWENVSVMTAVTAAAMACTLFMAKPVSAYQLGEVYAANMGVNIRRFRLALILVSSILSACVTAFAGPVSFVGIAVPRLIKGLFQTAKPLVMIPGCFLGGAVFCCFCDMIARTLFAPVELSISTVTAIFGAPVVIYMMVHKGERR